jgi:probable phosphoglycerate mutase
LASKWLRDGLYEEAELLVSSTLPRAEQTADHLQHALPAATRLGSREDLCELHPGEADALSWREYGERFGGVDWDEDATTPIAPGGESWATFTTRVVVALEQLVADYASNTIVMATHAGVIEASMLHFVFGGPETRRLGLRTDHCSVTEWAAFDGKWFLVRYNA